MGDPAGYECRQCLNENDASEYFDDLESIRRHVAIYHCGSFDEYRTHLCTQCKKTYYDTEHFTQHQKKSKVCRSSVMTLKPMDPGTTLALDSLVNQMAHPVESPMEIDQSSPIKHLKVKTEVQDVKESSSLVMLEISASNPAAACSPASQLQRDITPKSAPSKKKQSKSKGKRTSKTTGVSSAPSPAVQAKAKAKAKPKEAAAIKPEPEEFLGIRSCRLTPKAYREVSDSDDEEDSDHGDADGGQDRNGDSDSGHGGDGAAHRNSGSGIHGGRVKQETSTDRDLLAVCQICLELPFVPQPIPKMADKEAHALIHLSPLPSFVKMSVKGWIL